MVPLRGESPGLAKYFDSALLSIKAGFWLFQLDIIAFAATR
jgi:hypothetical protein